MLRTKLRITRMAALAVLLTFAFSGLAVARDYDDANYYGGNPTQARQYGYQNGYRDGFHHGQHERAENDPYDFRSRDWDRASNGYAGWMGPFGQFKDAYRDGYRQGYEAAFHGNLARRGYGDDHYFQRDDYRYGQPAFANNVAYNFGYQDGASVAREDVYKNKPFNPNPRGKYDDEDRGYHREYGDKNVYRAEYANGYRAGYQASFRRY